MDENLFIDNKSKKLPILPILFLLFVIILSGVLFWYNRYVIGKENEELSLQNSNLETSIKNIKKDKKIIINDILNKNKLEILKYETNSDIVKYMDHLINISRKYGIAFSGFSINNGDIKTKVNVGKLNIRGEKNPYEKVAGFIKNYREDENSLLDLKFINSFEGMDNIEFEVNFKTKNILKKTSDKKESEKIKKNISSGNLSDKSEENTKINLSDKQKENE